MRILAIALSCLLAAFAFRIPSQRSASQLGQLSMLSIGDTPPDFELVRVVPTVSPS